MTAYKFTADMARERRNTELDDRIEKAVRESSGNSAEIRVYCDDSFRWTIKEDLEARGFVDVDVPEIIIKGDVFFRWGAK